MPPRRSRFRLYALALLGVAAVVAAGASLVAAERYYYVVHGVFLGWSDLEPTVIDLGVPHPDRHLGGVIAWDLNGDGRRDFVVTGVGRISAFDAGGARLWTKEIDILVDGVAGLHAPGVHAADIDGDGKTEVLFLTLAGALHVLDGATGAERAAVRLPKPPAGIERWEHAATLNLRGEGDRDVILQTGDGTKYHLGRYIAAFALDRLIRDGEAAAPLWAHDDFVPPGHGAAKIADLDGDGRHEVIGGDIIGPDGTRLYRLPFKGKHLDSIFVGDVRPDLPGLEVVAAEEDGPQGVYLYNHRGLIWETPNRDRHDPQNVAVGDFDPGRPGLEIWCRSRFDRGQRPWMLDAQGALVARYELKDVAPKGWTTKGYEEISAIHWTGRQQHAVAKERHIAGDVALFAAGTGAVAMRLAEKADRVYVADVRGDWREEIIVVAGDKLHIYENPAPNPDPDRPSLWDQDHYRRSKLTWNYYSP